LLFVFVTIVVEGPNDPKINQTKEGPGSGGKERNQQPTTRDKAPDTQRRKKEQEEEEKQPTTRVKAPDTHRRKKGQEEERDG
jgi:hypothetical protein